MKKYDYFVIGAGPAGVAASYVLSKAGYRVALLEAHNALAMKPCGNGLVRMEDIPFPIPRSALKVRIRRGLLYVDGQLAVEIKDVVDGFIIDKREMLEELIASSGTFLFLKSHFNPLRIEIKLNNERLKLESFSNLILAGGHAFYEGEKIFAVETSLRPKFEIEDDKIEIWFDTKLIGYYWVFPEEDGKVQVGVGGYSSPSKLKRMLLKFIKRDERLSSNSLGNVRGAPLAVGGVTLKRYKDRIHRIGESAGYVLPLTGEGIRPSILSGYVFAKSMIESRDPVKALRSLNITRAIAIQRSILKRVKEMDLHRRRELLSSIPPEVHAEVALGTLRKSRIVKALAKNPRLLSSILKFIT